MFETAGAIRHGHFELSSGRHSGTYVQCALVLQYPRFAEKLGQALAELFSDVRVDAVVSPAIGGLIIGQEVARALPEPKSAVGGGVPALFAERDASGMMTLRRGFEVKPEQHVLVVEDVWTGRLDDGNHPRCGRSWRPRDGCGRADRPQRRND